MAFDMTYRFPVSQLKMSQEEWSEVFYDRKALSYHPKTLEFSRQLPRPHGYKSLSVDQLADITESFKGSQRTVSSSILGYNIGFVAFQESYKYAGLKGIIHRIFSRIFNFVVRGTFSSPEERCKKIAQELLDLAPFLKDPKARQKYRISCAKTHYVCTIEKVADNDDEKAFKIINHIFLRWLVEDKSPSSVVYEVLQLSPNSSL